MKGTIKKYKSKKFNADSGSMSQMVKNEENVKNVWDATTRVTVEYNGTITGTKHDDVNG